MTGLGARYVQDEPLHGVFSKGDLEEMLKELRYEGPVSVGAAAGEAGIVSISSTLPHWGLCNILEGTKGRIGEFLAYPFDNPLMESWTVSLLFSRFPYPAKVVEKTARIEGVDRGVENHFWFYPNVRVFKRTYTTEATKIGVASAWGDTLEEANSRAVSTCHVLGLPEKQFRTDGQYSIGAIWGRYKQAHR